MKRRLFGLLLILAVFLSATVVVFSKSSGDVLNVKISPATGEGDGKTGKKVRISFWFANINPEREAGYAELIRAFEKQNPEIQVDFLGIPGDSIRKLDMALAANEAPDCSDMVQLAMPSQITRNALVQLDSYFAKWPEKNQVVPAALEMVRSFDPSGKKRLFGIPAASNSWVLLARRDRLVSVGLKPPQTWDEFFKAVKALTDQGAGRYGVAIQGGADGGIALEHLMYSYSGLTKYFSADGKCTVNDAKHLEFVEKYLGLYNVYTAKSDLNKGWAELATAFQSGKTAMVFQNLGSFSQHAQFFNNDTAKFGLVPLPKSDQGYYVHSPLSVTGYVMYTNSTYQKETWKFISYLCSAEPTGISAKFTGMVPLQKQALAAPWIRNHPYLKTIADLLVSPNTKFYQAPINYPNYSNIMSAKIEPMIKAVMIKKLSAGDFLNEWARLMLQMKKGYIIH